MSDKGFILQSSYGSVFSVVEDLEEKVGEQNNEKLVTIAGRVNNPATIEIPENSTLRDVIELVGGIKNKKNFKAAQFGLPFGGFLTAGSLDKVIDFSLFRWQLYSILSTWWYKLSRRKEQIQGSSILSR